MVIKQLTVSVTTTIETILHVFTMLSSNNCETYTLNLINMMPLVKAQAKTRLILFMK